MSDNEKPKVSFKPRDGQLTHIELLDAITEGIRHQTEINLAIVRALIKIQEGNVQEADISGILDQSSSLLALNRILIDRYREVATNVR